jgi:uncharacterized membrane protein HdeD (DUF308 family)
MRPSPGLTPTRSANSRRPPGVAGRSAINRSKEHNVTTLSSRRQALNSLRDDLTRYWWLPLLSGIAWIVVSIVIFRFDYNSVAAISVLFGVIAIGTALTESMVAGVSTGGWRWLHFLLAVIFTIAGITAFFQPGGTFVALAAVVSFYLIFRGISDIATGFSLASVASSSWVSILAGFLELLIGFWAAGSWGLSATLLVAWVGAAALLHGLSDIFSAFRLRQHGSATL